MIALALITLLVSHHCFAQSETEISTDAKRINLANQGIEEPINFNDYENLEEIDLSHNKLTKVDRNVFASNSKLKTIDLSYNSFLEIPSVGPFLISSVETLNLTNCNIEIFPENAVDEMKNLHTLDLSGNQIKYKDSTFFIKNINPPKKVIVSDISDEDLKFVCKNSDKLTLVIKDKESLVNCKTFNKSPEEKLSEKKELQQELEDADMQIIEENGISNGSEELEEMLGDAPAEGSGDESEIPVTEKTEEIKSETVVDSSKNTGANETEVSSENETETDEHLLSAIENDEDDSVEVENKTEDPIENEVDGVSKHDEHSLPPNESANKGEESVDDQVTDKDNNTVFGNSSSESQEPEDQIDNNTKLLGEIKTEEAAQSRTVLRSEKPQGAVQVNKEQQQNASENIVHASTDQVDADTGSTNIILLVIVGVVLVGAGLVGYKFWKNKKEYTPVTKDPNQDSKELQEIKVLRTNNQNQPEVKPLLCSLPTEVMEGKEEKVSESEEVDHPVTNNGDISAKDIIADPDNKDIPDMDASIVNIPEATDKSK